MSLEEQRKELAEIMKEAKEGNEEIKKNLEPIEIETGFWFKYKGRTFVFKGLKEDRPEFVEYIKLEGVNMAVDQNGNWIGHLNNVEMTDLELGFYNQAKRIMMNMKYSLLDFEKVIDFLEKTDINNMTLLEAVIINMLTGKTFVKNSWSDEAKSRLQTFIYDRKLITQDGNEVSTKSGSVKIESSERYSLYRGKYVSLIDSNNEKVQRMRHLEEEIMPFYNKMKEYEDLKRELNL
jgi:hypothetical protein